MNFIIQVIDWFKDKRRRAEPAPFTIRDVVMTTIYNRLYAYPAWQTVSAERRKEIADNIALRVRGITPRDVCIERLIEEFERVEFSICEDLCDGSLA